MTTPHQLAMRDPATAILMGGIPTATFGNDFGNDPYFGTDFGAQFGAAPVPAGHPAMHPTSGVPVHPAANHLPPHHPYHPQNHAKMMHVWEQFHKAQAVTESRGRLIEPNKGSSVKIERYTFSLNQPFTLGVPVAISISSAPDTDIRPQRININAPMYQFAQMNEIKVANVSVAVGGILDAFMFNANAVDQEMDLPTLSPSNKATVLGNYTGLTPPGFPPGFTYLFTVSFTGPARITA